MVPTLSAGTILIWLAWGFFMGVGWSVGSWTVNKLLSALG